MILVIYFVKVINMTNGTKKGEEKSKSQPDETIAKKFKLRRQKTDDEIYLTCHQLMVMKKL